MINLPMELTENNFLKGLQQSESWICQLATHRSQHPNITIDRMEWVEPGGLAPFAHLMRHHHITVPNLHPKVHPYIQRMNFTSMLGLPDSYAFTEHKAEGRFIPAVFVRTQEEIEPVISGVKEILDRSSLALGVRWAAAWSINELLGNVLIHSRATDGGLVFAQVFPSRGTVQITVSDMGIGIVGSMRESGTPWDGASSNECQLALKRGWSTKKGGEGAGNGLYLIQSIVQNNGPWSRVSIVSGTALAIVDQHQTAFSRIRCHWPGTVITCTLDLNIPVDMQQIVGDDLLSDDAWEVAEW